MGTQISQTTEKNSRWTLLEWQIQLELTTDVFMYVVSKNELLLTNFPVTLLKCSGGFLAS